jgi:heptosyltransferase-2
MRILIVKLGATGDVVRTTTLLHVLNGEISWLTSDLNQVMLQGCQQISEIIPWSRRDTLIGRSFDLVINLEDDREPAELARKLAYGDLAGAYLNDLGEVAYTENLNDWFDLSLISRFGRKKADELKLKNRRTFQEMLFSGMGFLFTGQTYHLPPPTPTDLTGDIAIAPDSGAVWPMKKWAYYDELKNDLEHSGFKVNYLPMRRTLSEHIQDVQNHRYLVSGDSLPMHIALGSGIKCLSIFICTSPWEIYDYKLQVKVVSPLLEKHFYKRDFKPEAARSIGLEEVYNSIVNHLQVQGK